MLLLNRLQESENVTVLTHSASLAGFGAARRVVGVGAARRVGARKRDWMDLFDHQDCVPNFAPMYAIWPLVLCTAQGGGDGRRGIFVELGANDGLAETNTLSM